MLKRNKKFTAILAGLFLSATLSCITPMSVSAASNRLWGQDRYETAAAISKQGWTSSDYVIVASGEGYADALCASPLAKKYNAPILLTGSKGLNDKTKEEIKRLNAKHVYIIGKYASVSKDAEEELKAIAEVKRLGGNDRYETSVIVAKELGTINSVVITSGYGFADALSMAPIAAQKNMPILLTGKEELSSVVKGYIDENKASIKDTYLVGGTGVISDKVSEQASSAAVRLSGQNRFETNAKIMEHFLKDIKFDNVYVVQGDGPTGMEFADALSGTALAVKTSSPVILTYNNLSSSVESLLKSNIKKESTIFALGGTAAVPQDIVTTLEKAAADSEKQPEQPTKPTTPSTPAGGTTGGGGGSTSGGGGSTTTPSNNGTDGDVEVVFSKNPSVRFNVNNESSIDISNSFKNNNLIKIRIYSSTARSVKLSIDGYSTTKQVSQGWTELKVPSDFGVVDGGAPGVGQSSFDIMCVGGKFDLSIKSGDSTKTISVKYK